VQQHLGRQSGVAKVEVTLIDGKVQITPKEDGQVDLVQLLTATYDSGVTVAEMDMTAQGRIVKDGSGNLALHVAPNLSFVFEPNDLSKGLEPLAGTQTVATVRGQLYKKPPGKSKKKADVSAPLKLLLFEVENRY